MVSAISDDHPVLTGARPTTTFVVLLWCVSSMFFCDHFYSIFYVGFRHFNVHILQALTVLADETAPAGTFWSAQDLIRQIQTWSTSLDGCLNKLNLFQKNDKQFLVVSCVSL